MSRRLGTGKRATKSDGREYRTTRARVQHALESSFGSAHYVLAAWEIEAWLLLFPATLESFVSSWKVPKKLRNKDTGKISDPKRVLAKEISGAARSYREADSPEIILKAMRQGEHRTLSATNRSWTTFHDDVLACCSSHILARGGNS